MFLAGAPVAWLWLALCAVATVPVAVWYAIQGRLLEPLPVIAAACAVLFVLRPLQLILEWPDLYSYFAPADPVRSLTLLEGQEVALYVTGRLQEPLETAFARALGACALFLALFLAGYGLAAGRRIGLRLAALRGRGAALNELAAIGLSLVIGFAAQVAIVIRAGGPGESLRTASTQTALSESFVLFVLAGFAPAAVVVWVAWRRPRGRLEWAALISTVAAVCAFAIVAGSRARVLITVAVLAVIVHYLRRPWRLRELALAAVVFLAFATSFVVFRSVANEHSLGRAATVASEHVLDHRVILNDVTSFDQVLYATTIYGRSRPHDHGQFLLNGLRSYVPRSIDPHKPEGGDIKFRKVVWGEQFGAGRPPTAVGDLFIDFGFAGVAVGALFIGIAARSLLGLVRGPPAGREYRVALYALLLVVLYELVTGTFSIALGFALTLVLPFLVAVHGFGRLPGARRATARTSR